MFSETFIRNFWLLTISIFSLAAYVKYRSAPSTRLLRRSKPDNVAPLLYCIVLAALLGFRDIYDVAFADTVVYRACYFNLADNSGQVNVNFGEEWLWNEIMRTFVSAKIQIEYFFTFVAAGYIGFMLWGVKRLIPYNQWIAMLFCISSFSFLTYGYNGIRNGLACSIVILAITFFIERNKRHFLYGILLSLIAISIHGSTALPVVCCLLSVYFIRNTKYAIVWWLLSIAISLLFGQYVQIFFANLGFDDRMTSYAGTLVENSRRASEFSSTGFRFDFLLYSAMPILLGYYIVVKRGIRNVTYEMLLNTYILSNAFWVMVIRAAYSNRFAYLSWFLYPVVFAYPLLKVYFSPRQDRITVNILIGFVLFTLFMQFYTS